MDTIFAPCTPPGKSGVAVLRVSGPQAGGTLALLGVMPLPTPRMAKRAKLTLAGEALDHALVLYFAAPHSFTGEDVVEYHIHGSRAVMARLLAALGAMPGLRPAEPGEFTRRAYLNGKMDLTAAEGLADLIDAETEAQRRQAMRFMQGDAARFYNQLRQQVLEALALTEAYIDFPEEEIPPAVIDETRERAVRLTLLIEKQLQGSASAERVRDGVRVAIIGPPNAGKSSLMNLLAGRDIAIVSHKAGTTRDVIEAHLDIGGFAVIVADTAGLREAEDEIEREGIRRSLARARDADIRILVLDASLPPDESVATLIDANTIVLSNKIDSASAPFPLPSIPFSVRDGTGMDELLAALRARVALNANAESSFVARGRHRHHLTQALLHLRRYDALKEAGLELQCEELRRAAHEIGRLTGAIDADEILGQIFSRFCIGK